MQGRAPVHVGRGFNQGVSGGEATHVLTTDEVPPHSHQAFATSGAATTATPSPAVMLAQSTSANLYAPATCTANMAANAVASTGGSQPHENQQPYLAINFCIALAGVYPSGN